MHGCPASEWHGPVETSTPAGSFSSWYVDFRPVLPGQVSQYSTLDADTINYMSFFIVRHDGRLKVAMRTEGVFRNKGCVTYEVIDRVDESSGTYRFSDFKAGDERAYTLFDFGDDEFTPNKLRFISRYVYLPVGTTSYTFTHVHPGEYYLYAYNDINQDKLHKSGDYISSDIRNTLVLSPESHEHVKAHIDYVIP